MSLPTFANEPWLELRRAPEREGLTAALRALDAELPLSVPILVGGDRGSAEGLVSTDPGAPGRVVAHAGRATAADVDAAVAAATAAAPGWAATPAEERAEILVRAAATLRADRRRLAALAVRECAKPWAEADADICEAIDFLEYYARGALALARGRELFQVPGERNDLHYAPRGVVAVISPWNFPLAIPCGMVSAGLATGNTVVLKPAEQSPACAGELIKALHGAGVPPGALSLLPGEGEVGAALVSHPGVHTIAFTGSLPVGLEIARRAAETPAEQKHLKRVIAELGGKNCVIVDSDADLDEAVPGIIASAFAYAGQKCSAAARVLVHEAVADQLATRLAGAVELLRVGPADEFGIDVPPVIEQAARDRVAGYGEEVAASGRVLARAPAPDGEGWFCPAVLGAELPPDAGVLREEVFGPLLTLERVRSVEHALEVVDGLRFALTGGLFSRNPRTVADVAARSPVGNLYVNRSTTGAMVGRQPFGGNRLSGTGTKAGGPDYLLHFVEPHVVCENTMRHGLVV